MSETTPKPKVPEAVAVRVAASADANIKTVRKVLSGGRARGTVDERIRRAARAMGLEVQP